MTQTTAIPQSIEDPNFRYPSPVLCYVDDDRAWFTTLPLSQMSDLCDWKGVKYGDEDTCYPYTYEEHLEWYSESDSEPLPRFDTVEVYFSKSSFWSGWLKDNFAIDWINSGVTAWMISNRPNNFDCIFAGTSIQDFITKIEGAGGSVFMTPQDCHKYYPTSKES